MDILKQHYEKIVFGALLLGFVLALVYLLHMVESANIATSVKLSQDIKIAPHNQQDFTDKALFSEEYKLGERSLWHNREDKDNLGFTADLVAPMHALRCANKECSMIMPWSFAKKRKCNFCGAELADPGNPPDYESEIAKLDSDSDGMPDRYELKMGFNPLDPNDASADKDGDGFSNLYEFMVRTDPTDRNSIPPLEKCLYLVALRKKVLPVMLESVQVNPDPADKNSKKNWDITLTLNSNRESHVIGDEITVSGVKYKLVDAEYRTKDQQEASVVLAEEASRATLVPIKNGQLDPANKIELEVGKKSFAPDHLVLIRDVRNNRGYRLARNSSITIKGEDDKSVTLQVLATDPVKETVTLVNVETDNKFILEKSTGAMKNAFVRNNGQNNNEPAPVNNQPRRRRRVRN